MNAVWLCVLAAPLVFAPLEGGRGLELVYNGTFEKVSRNDANSVVKQFKLYSVLSSTESGARQLDYLIDERGAGGWPWPERYGRQTLSPDLKLEGLPLRILYEHSTGPLGLTVASPIFAAWDRLKEGEKWTEGRETWTVEELTKLQERPCWRVEAVVNVGRKRTVWVDKDLPLVLAVEERVFVGQGEEHLLTLKLSVQKELTAEELAKSARPLAGLLELQTRLDRKDSEFRPELTEEQLALITAALPQLSKDAEGTPWAPLVAAITRDSRAQQSRQGELDKLSGRYVGKAAPALDLTTLDKQALSAESFKGKTVVLHFWEYQAEPLVEPYGQAAYLDFLYGKRKKIGVEAVGIAVDSRLADPQTRSAALRSIMKFKNFMNLSYPLVSDDGTLLKKFGDPRQAGAKLPLWVVIGPDGKVAHYHVGLYKVNSDEGLKELEETLIRVIRESRGK